MIKLSTRRLAPLGVAAMIAATTALTGTTGASAAARSAAAVLPTFTNGAIAYSCQGYANAPGNDGWVTTKPGGGLWTDWGKYYGGVSWSPDGTEMVHDATFTADSFGGRDTQHTVFLSEDDADYPWQSTNYDNTAGVTDTETTF
ncbi:MAG: hypothetical protein ACHQE5_06910, partial [Actinomycetes bacterium]